MILGGGNRLFADSGRTKARLELVKHATNANAVRMGVYDVVR